MVEFASKKMNSVLLDPREGFKETTVKPEFRFDPLTGETRRLGHFGMIKPQKPDLESLDGPEIRKRCPFCPDNIDKMTPRYPADVLEAGFLQKGEARLVPNIAPYDLYSGLCIISEKHLLKLEDMSEKILKDSFELSFSFYNNLSQKEPETAFWFLGWNYMPPSGGGLIHPHQQVVASTEPGNFHRKLLVESKKYKREHGKEFWDELCQKEKEIGERFIKEGKNVNWIVSFAPLGVVGEYIALFPGRKTLDELDDESINEFVSDLRNLFNYFISEDIYSFNFGLYFAPQKEVKEGLDGEGFTLQARIIPRVFLNLDVRPPDANVLQMLMQEPFSVVYPEELCKGVKPYLDR